MLKRSLFLSSLLLSVSVWADSGTQAAGAAQDAPKPAATVAQASGPDPVRVALLGQRHMVRRQLFQLRAARDSALSRLSLARLAISRGAESPDKKTDKDIVNEMRSLEADYNQRLDAERARLAAIDAKLAKLGGAGR
ncbi:MAG: hypothetical protein Q4D91_04080 [Lautropia sp.]|nr:hypothetical protein [Lautropia sp.]